MSARAPFRQQPWNDADIARLRDLAVAGFSHAEIARQMKRSKNSVVGKLDRLGLLRPSPIKPAARAPSKPKRGTAIPLPSFPSERA